MTYSYYYIICMTVPLKLNIIHRMKISYIKNLFYLLLMAVIRGVARVPKVWHSRYNCQIYFINLFIFNCLTLNIKLFIFKMSDVKFLFSENHIFCQQKKTACLWSYGRASLVSDFKPTLENNDLFFET